MTKAKGSLASPDPRNSRLAFSQKEIQTMIHQSNHSLGATQLMWAATLLAVAFVSAQPSNVPAQTQTQTNVTTPVPPGGTINKIPKWTAGTELGDSVITELNGNIGIGTTNPQSSLHVVRPGAIFFSRTFLMSDTVSSPQSAIQLGFNGGTMAAGGGPSLLFFSDNSDRCGIWCGYARGRGHRR